MVTRKLVSVEFKERLVKNTKYGKNSILQCFRYQ
jgi:hypothetical protein